MSMVGVEADLVRSFAKAGLSDSQQRLVRAFLRAIQPNGYLSQHASSANPAAVAVAKAHAVLFSRGNPRRGMSQQPSPKLTLKMLTAAQDTVGAVLKLSPSDADLQAASDLLTSATALGEHGLTPQQPCRDHAAKLDLLQPAVREAIKDLFRRVWDKGSAPDVLDRIGLETAGLSLWRGRDHDSLMIDLSAVLRKRPVTGLDALSALLPDPQSFRTALVVEGTYELAQLTELTSSAEEVRQFRLGASPSGWGLGTERLREFADTAARSCSGAGVLLTVRTSAPDRGVAADQARRSITELLDQYVAGQRLADLRLAPETFVYSETTNRSETRSAWGTDHHVVRPLTGHWPGAIRESLRTAHIARSTSSPVTSTGLCWAAIEALGVKHSSTAPGSHADLARALSLQSLRQQVVAVHQLLRTCALGAITASRRSHSDASRGLAALQRRARQADAKAVALPTAVLDQMDDAHQELLLRQRDVEATRTAYQEPLDALDAWAVVDGRGWLVDLNRWVDVLVSAPTTSEQLTKARLATEALCIGLGSAVAPEVNRWKSLLSDPGTCAQWLQQTAARFEWMLDWLYVTRNLALHNGVFESAADALDVHGARALVDMTLEFLGNWYQAAVAENSDRVDWSAPEIIRHLSIRQGDIIKELKSAVALQLNAAHLTSPTSNGWDRP
ncbi:hypothetical protein ABZ747_29330 [Kitasatospora cineracea]|uniref:hypothetical protein n=1 Tax=Kitasatospora cineracea TaxID=88074 RepID=UPI0033F3302E